MLQRKPKVVRVTKPMILALREAVLQVSPARNLQRLPTASPPRQLQSHQQLPADLVQPLMPQHLPLVP